MHQPLGGAQGQASDIEIAAREIIRLQEKLRTMLADNTGQSYDKIAMDTDRDYYLTADQAAEYGLIDEILGKKPDEPAPQSAETPPAAETETPQE